MTIRRLADRIEYSQPVLYGHFAGRDEIVSAVAMEGFAEMASALAKADGIAEVGRAYVDFASQNPTLYDAMFTQTIDLLFGQEGTPQLLKDCFLAIRRAVEPLAGERDPETLTEVFWSALHGQVMLDQTGRLRSGLTDVRVDLLITEFTRGRGARPAGRGATP